MVYPIYHMWIMRSTWRVSRRFSFEKNKFEVTTCRIFRENWGQPWLPLDLWVNRGVAESWRPSEVLFSWTLTVHARAYQNFVPICLFCSSPLKACWDCQAPCLVVHELQTCVFIESLGLFLGPIVPPFSVSDEVWSHLKDCLWEEYDNFVDISKIYLSI